MGITRTCTPLLQPNPTFLPLWLFPPRLYQGSFIKGDKSGHSFCRTEQMGTKRPSPQTGDAYNQKT
jgi:hypothetical protein